MTIDGVTIPAGSSSTTISVVPVDDAAVEDDETVEATLAADSAYTVDSGSNSATVTIHDNDLPTVMIYASDADGDEDGPDHGEFTITLEDGSEIMFTQSAIVLENLIGKFLVNAGSGGDD